MSKELHKGAVKSLFQRARELRNNSTHAEDILWTYLKTKPLGYKFRRQHPYSIYILDFYCHPLKLAIEIDGNIHAVEEVKSNDIVRQKLLEEDGLKVLRFTNEEVFKQLEIVIKEIEKYIQNKKDD
jgi:cyclase